MKTKRILWTLGSVAAIASPVVVVVSCGKKNDDNHHTTRTDGLIKALRTGNGISVELHKLVKLKNFTDQEIKNVLDSARASKYVPSLLKMMLKNTDSSVKMWKNLLNKGEASKMYNAFVELSTKGLKNMTKREVIANLNHKVGQALTEADKNAIVDLYNSRYNSDSEINNVFNAVMNTTEVNNNEVNAGSETVEDYNDAVAIAWIKNHMTVKEMESIIDKMPSDFIKTFRPVISGILENLDLNMGTRHISLTKQTASSDASLLVNIVNDAWTHPIGYQGNTSLYAVARLGDLRALTQSNETIQSILNLIYLLTGAASNQGGIAGELHISNLSTGDNKVNAVRLIDSIVSFFLKKEVKAGSPEGTVSAFDKTAPLIRGLLLGFDSEENAKESLEKLSPMLSKQQPVINTSIASLFAQLWTNSELQDSNLQKLIGNVITDPRFMPSIHNLLTKGILGMTRDEIEELLRSFKNVVNSNGILILKNLLDDLKINNMPFIDWLKLIFTEHTVISVSNGIYDILHTKMEDIKPSSFNAIIELINNTGLIKKHIPLMGEAIHALIHDSPSAVSAGQWSSIMAAFSLDAATSNMIMNIALGNNYATQGVSVIKANINALQLPEEHTLLSGTKALEFAFDYATLKTKFNEIKNSILPTLSLVQLYDKYTEMQSIITKVNEINSAVTSNNDSYNAEFDKANAPIQDIIKTMPVEVVLTDNTKVDLLGTDSWDKIKKEWVELTAKIHKGTSAREITALTVPLEDLVSRAKKLNKIISFVNKYHSLDITEANLTEALEIYSLNDISLAGGGRKFVINAEGFNALYAHGAAIFSSKPIGLSLGDEIHASGATVDGKTEMSLEVFINAMKAIHQNTISLKQDSGASTFHL